MKHNLIKRNNYLLVVDDTEITVKDWTYSPMNGIILISSLGLMISIDTFTKKIISHLPLNGAAVLTGVPLLPPFEDDVEKLAKEKYPVNMGEQWTEDGSAYPLDYNYGFRIGFIEGYNITKEKYKYTEEVIRAIKRILIYDDDKNDEEKISEVIRVIESLQHHPKYPIAFECEVITRVYDVYPQRTERKPKTITNSQGRTEWVGKYIYE